MPKKITPKQREEIVKKIYALRARGLTLEEVGRELKVGNPGTHKQAVSHYLKGRTRIAKWKYGPVKKGKK